MLAAGHIGDGLARGVARQFDFAHQCAIFRVEGPEIGRIGIDFDLDGVASGRVVDHVPLRLRRGEEQTLGDDGKIALCPAQGRQVEMGKAGMIAWPLAHGDLPAVLAGVEVNGRDPAVGRLEQGQAARPVGTEFYPAGIAERGVGVGVFGQGQHGRERIGRNVDHAFVRIDGSTSPARAADNAGNEDRPLLIHALHGLRYVERAVAIVVGDGLGHLVQSWRKVDQIVLSQALALKGGRFAGNGLGGRGLFAGDVGLRDGFFLDGPDWLARLAVEDEAEALFGDLGHGFDFPASDVDIDEVGRRRQIVVPHPVVGGLEVPDALARSGVEADEALGEEVVAGTVPAIVIVSRSADRQIDIAQFGIGAH